MQAAHSMKEQFQPVAPIAIDGRSGVGDSEENDQHPDRSFGEMAGQSVVMQRLFSQMGHTARHLRIAVIEGETGTGKMLAARTLHEFGSSPEAPFVPCVAARLLAMQAGVGSQPGIALVSSRSLGRADFFTLPALQQSCGGTLVLARVDELSHPLQSALLELLQWVDHRHIQRALDSIPHRILCLSARPLRKLAAVGAFRSDLANRLTAIRFALPPLRDRREDIPLLADLFARHFSATHGKSILGLSPQTLPALFHHAWPGNVRELETVICSAALTCHGQWIRPIDLPALTATPNLAAGPASTAPSPETNPPAEDDPNLDRAILRHIQRVLAKADGNKLRAARLLGISRSTLYRLLDSPNSASPGNP